jgi:hypothetical protein
MKIFCVRKRNDHAPVASLHYYTLYIIRCMLYKDVIHYYIIMLVLSVLTHPIFIKDIRGSNTLLIIGCSDQFMVLSQLSVSKMPFVLHVFACLPARLSISSSLRRVMTQYFYINYYYYITIYYYLNYFLYRPSDRRLSAKLVPTFADRGCHVDSMTGPYAVFSAF